MPSVSLFAKRFARSSPVLRRAFRSSSCINKNFPKEFVDVERSASVVTSPEKGANTADHVARSMRVIDDTLQSRPRFVEIWRRMG
jgi:hypothetical protein